MTTLGVKVEEAVSFVIFGATGDLAQRKLIPALYTLFRDNALPDSFAVIGFARREHTDATFREFMMKALHEHSRLPIDEDSLSHFCAHLHYQCGDLSDPKALNALSDRFKTDPTLPGNRLFYLSIASDLVEQTVKLMHETGLITPVNHTPWTRIVIEKPFGRDLESAQALNRALLDHLAEPQIYRIDHYLGKETVQNILSFRFANTIFEPLFNRAHVDHIQITAAEKVGMESGRGAFYDRTGALRDMVANHMFQLLCLVTMEPPDGLTAQAIRTEKMKILNALKPAEATYAHPPGCFGQYSGNNDTPAFLQEDRVNPESRTETFVALRMELNNWRWAGVPIYLRTGKRMAKKVTEIVIQFKPPPLNLFQHVACEGDVCDLTGLKPNTLTFRIQPDEGIFLQISSKRPSMQLVVESVNMDFSYSGKWAKELPEAYERLLLDALRGDSTLFTRSDEVEAEWGVIGAILENMRGDSPVPYASGSWGPHESDTVHLSNSWKNE